jgi:hypothetical protein
MKKTREKKELIKMILKDDLTNKSNIDVLLRLKNK